MPELVCREPDWRKQKISGLYEDVPEMEISSCYKWNTRFERGVKWDNRAVWAVVITATAPKRSSHHLLNEKIDKIYEELAYLTALRSQQSDPGLETQIACLSQELRGLQIQEADLVRTYTKKKLSGALSAGLAILAHADELLEKYGIAPNEDATTQESNPAKA